MRLALFAFLLSLPSAVHPQTPVDPARAAYEERLSKDAVDAGALYELGHIERREGRYAQAKALFLRLLEVRPDSGGALEGLTLACLRLGEHGEAAGYADRWWRVSPGSAYVAELRAQAHRRAGLDSAAEAARDWSVAAPGDERARSAWDRYAAERRGLFPEAYAYRSEVTEGLDTAAPQRIAYEGRAAGAEMRAPLGGGLDVSAGVKVRQEAQLNESGGFPYYDLVETVPSLSVGWKPADGARLSARYSRSSFSDVTAGSVGGSTFDGGSAEAAWEGDAARASASWTRAPKLARGTGASLFFAILRADYWRAELGRTAFGWDLRAGAGLDRYSEGTDNPAWSASASREWGSQYAHLGWSRREQEFYGADAVSGRLRFVAVDRAGARWRWRDGDRLSVSAGAGRSWYEDSNRGEDWSVNASWAVPRLGGLSLDYGFTDEQYRLTGRSYRAFDETAHRFGPRLRRALGRGVWGEAAYSRGILTDDARDTYDSQEWTGGLDWHASTALRASLSGVLRDNTAGDDAWSGALSLRWSF